MIYNTIDRANIIIKHCLLVMVRVQHDEWLIMIKVLLISDHCFGSADHDYGSADHDYGSADHDYIQSRSCMINQDYGSVGHDYGSADCWLYSIKIMNDQSRLW